MGKYGSWFPKKLEGQKLEEFFIWLNNWGDLEKYRHLFNGEKKSDYTRGYEQAVSDVFNKLNIEYKPFDKRTKTGYKKDKGDKTPRKKSEDKI